MENALKVASLSLTNARQCLERENYGRAFANFLLFLKLEPARQHEVYLEFSLATRQWCEELELGDRIEDLFNCYDQACELFPNHDTVLNNIGAQLFRLGYVEEAAAYIRRSLLINPNYLAARDNLENLCCHLVERWHFAMLNDKRRNMAYKLAIEKAIKAGYDSVLDIGTGTAILSLMSEKCGARSVVACDSSRAMVEVARDVLAANGVSQQVTLIHKPSTELIIPADLSNRVKLVVTEIFDAGLFGEHAVSTLIHAWRNLISTSPMGTIVPCGATMYVCGIECERIRRQNRLLYPVLQHLDLSRVDVLTCTGRVAEEPYTTENLAKVPGGYRIITNISELLRVNFCNLFELESLNKGKDWVCDLYVKQRGQVDALAVWFDLLLDDSVTIATGADAKSCWEQAIYPVTNLKREPSGGNESLMARKKETLRSVFHFEQDCLRLVGCEILEEMSKLNTSHGAATDQCGCRGNQNELPGTATGLALPFRKRKVVPMLCCPDNSLSQPSQKEIQNFCTSPQLEQKEIQNFCTSPQLEQKEIQNFCTSPQLEQKEIQNLCACTSSVSSFNQADESEKLTDKDGIYKEDFCDSLRSVSIDSGTSYVHPGSDMDQCDIPNEQRVGIKTDKCSSCMVQAGGNFGVKSDKTEYDIVDCPSYMEQGKTVCDKETLCLELKTDKCSCWTGNTQGYYDKDESCLGLETDKCGYCLMQQEQNFYIEKLQQGLKIDKCSSGMEQGKRKVERNECPDCLVIKESECAELCYVTSDIHVREEICKSTESSEDLCAKIRSEGKDNCTAKSKPSYLDKQQRIVCLAEQAEIEYLNDIYLNKQYIGTLESYLSSHTPSSPTLLYLSPRLSFVGIQACQMGFDTVVMVTPQDHHATIKQVAELNGCSRDGLVLIDSASVESVQIAADVILTEVVEPYGALGQHTLENVTFQRMASLKAGGLILPYEVRIYGVYIESDELENLNHVTDNDRTLDFTVAEYINVFQMHSHMDIDLSTLTYNKLSDVFELLTLRLNEPDTTEAADHTVITNLADCQLERSVVVTANGKVSALVYWFELQLSQDLTANTLDARCHWKQAAFMTRGRFHAVTGQTLVTMVTLQNSCLGIMPVLPIEF